MIRSLRTFGLLSVVALATAGLAGCAADTADGEALTDDGTENEVKSGKAAITTFVGQDEQLYFHVKGANGEIILTSEGYVGKSGLDNGVASFKENASKRANFEIRESDGQSYLVVKAQNNEIIARGETYASRSNAQRALDRAARLVTNIKISEAPRVSRFETFKSDNDGQFYWHLRAGNGEIVLQSEGYKELASAQKGADSVRANGTDASRFTVKAAAGGDHYFVLQAANGEIIGTSEIFKAKAGAEKSAARVRLMLGAQLRDLQPTASAN